MSGSFRYSLITSAILFSASSWAADTTVTTNNSDTTEQTANAGSVADTGSASRVDTVTVVGNWLDSPDYDEVVLDHAGARSIIDKKTIEEKGSESIADALRGVPGVQVQESNGTGGSDISLNLGVRGLNSRLSPRSTILMDGIPVSYAPYGQPQLSLAPLSMGNIQSVDVIRGGTAVRYGPQNVGGVINFVSKPIPKDFGGSVSAQTQGADHGGLKTLTTASIGGTADNGFGAELLYSGLHGQGYRKHNDNEDIDDFMLKTRYDFTERDALEANFHYYTASAGMPGGLTKAQYQRDPFQNSRQFDDFEGRRQDMSFKYIHQGDDSQFQVQTYFTKSFRTSNLQQDACRDINNPDAECKDPSREHLTQLHAAPRHYTTWAIEPSYSKLFRFGDMAHEVTVGYRYMNETSDEKGYHSILSDNGSNADIKNGNDQWYDPRTVYSAPDSKGFLYRHNTGGTAAHAFYIDDTINVGNWTITPGVRYESIKTHVDSHNYDNAKENNGSIKQDYFSREKSYSQTLPSINVMYHLSDSWKLFANANSSFGSLQYAQLTTGGNGNRPATGLKPEKAYTYEVGTRYDDTALKAELTAFYIDFSNQLQYIDNITGWTSLGATKHQGIELAASYDLGDLTPTLDGASVYSSYTYTRAVATKGNFANKDLPMYSRQVFTVGGRYTTGNWTWNVDGYAQSGQQSPGSAKTSTHYITDESDSGQYGRSPGYMVWGARGEYNFGPSMSNLRIGAGVKNLFDQRYFIRSTDNNYGKYVGAPRTYYVQASVDF